MSELSKVPFLASLDAPDLEALTRLMTKRSYEAGDLIYADGTPGEGLYYVDAGTVAVMTSESCDGEIMAHLPQGSTFGESALLNDKPRANAVRAATDCTIYVLPRSAFQSYLQDHPAAGQMVSQALVLRPARGPRQLANEVLRSSSLFTGVADDALIAIARKMRPLQACLNTMVFSEGQDPDALYVVESGAIQLLGPQQSGRVPLAEIGPHDYFGEDALLTDQPRETSALATSAADLWAFSRSDFDAIVNGYPAAALALTRTMAARSERLNRMLLANAAAAHPVRRAANVPVAAPVIAPAAARPVAAVRPVADATPMRPVEPAMPLGVALREWLANLGTPGKVRLALISGLLAWLLLVSIPSAIAGGVSTGNKAPTLDPRDTVMLESARGGAAVRGFDTIDVPVLDALAANDVSLAPMAHLGDLVASVATPTVAAPAPAVAPPTPVLAAPTATPLPSVTYAVAAGDTLFGIASEFNIDMDVLAQANQISDASLIHIGQELVIPGGDEQKQIAVKLASQPKPTPVPVAAAPASVAAAAAPAAPPAPAAKPELPFVWDSRMDKHNIGVERAQAAPGQQYYRLVKALFKDTNEDMGANMPNGDHNIYIEVLDESGKRMLGVKTIIRNGGTAVLTTENKPFPEYAANFPMYGMLGSYSSWVDGMPSDKVTGMGLPMKWHVSYYLTWQLTTK